MGGFPANAPNVLRTHLIFMIAVRFDQVTKSFPRHTGHMLLRQRLANLLHRKHRKHFEALTNVSFVLRHGECLGIIGHNGAGKSTVLNLITGLCFPSSGVVSVEGKVAALLDLGSGFHPDLTGAENIQLNAALLGLTRKETTEQFQSIVRFAGIEDFLHEPLRTFSAGMVMRLAFAVAINVDPDILVIDEVLGVGDQEFVDKCVGRIEEFRRAGKTMICISHSLDLIALFCDRVIWLDHGRIVVDGKATDVLPAYRAHVHRETLVAAQSAR
jgi:ABC-type polysaccharide/polyol phosphate transport system ATPase subunit